MRNVMRLKDRIGPFAHHVDLVGRHTEHAGDLRARALRHRHEALRLSARKLRLDGPQQPGYDARKDERRMHFGRGVVEHRNHGPTAEHRHVRERRGKQKRIDIKRTDRAAHAQQIDRTSRTIGRRRRGLTLGGRNHVHVGPRRKRRVTPHRAVHHQGEVVLRTGLHHGVHEAAREAAVATTVHPGTGVDADLHARLVSRRAARRACGMA